MLRDGYSGESGMGQVGEEGTGRGKGRVGRQQALVVKVATPSQHTPSETQASLRAMATCWCAFTAATAPSPGSRLHPSGKLMSQTVWFIWAKRWHKHTPQPLAG